MHDNFHDEPDQEEETQKESKACCKCTGYEKIDSKYTDGGYCRRIHAGDYAQTPCIVDNDFWCKYFEALLDVPSED